MKIAIAGSFPEDVRARIQSCFPAEWDVRIAAPEAAAFPGVEPRELDALLRESDVVSLHVPLNGQTRHLFGDEAFARMKPDALLVNTARGAVVDEAALIRALRDGAIGGACLDVFEAEPLPEDSPLRELPNVILTPHTAGFPDGPGFHRKRYAFFAENIRRFWAGEVPEGRMNLL